MICPIMTKGLLHQKEPCENCEHNYTPIICFPCHTINNYRNYKKKMSCEGCKHFNVFPIECKLGNLVCNSHSHFEPLIENKMTNRKCCVNCMHDKGWGIYHKPILLNQESSCKLGNYTCQNYSHFEQKSEIKFKQVVKEIPAQKLMMITYNWLREQKACQDAIDAFVNEFGKEAEYYTVVSALNKRANYFVNYFAWQMWLTDKKHLLQVKENVSYVLVENVDWREKVYIGVCKNGIRHVLVKRKNTTPIQIYVAGLDDTFVCYSISTLNDLSNSYNIYEFDTFDDFVEWYQQNKYNPSESPKPSTSIGGF